MRLAVRHAMRHVARIVLGGFLVFAGIAHLVNVGEFLGQVPTWLPEREAIVVVSGLVEIVFGAGLLITRGARRAQVGWLVAALFVAVFPGNVWQWASGSDAFGLDTDTGRAVRLAFQPLLIAWALWCTGAWAAWRAGRADRRRADSDQTLEDR